jgi:hypothetical protein
VAVRAVLDVDAPRLAADLAILDVVLPVAAPRIEPDGHGLSAVRAGHLAFDVGRAVAQRKIAVEVEVVGLRVESEAHLET